MEDLKREAFSNLKMYFTNKKTRNNSVSIIDMKRLKDTLGGYIGLLNEKFLYVCDDLLK